MHRSPFQKVPGPHVHRLSDGLHTVSSRHRMHMFPFQLLLSGHRHTLLQGSQNWPRPQGTWQQSQAGS